MNQTSHDWPEVNLRWLSATILTSSTLVFAVAVALAKHFA